MRAVILIAGNFVREQRWYLVLLLLWAFGMAALLGGGRHFSADELFFYLHQQAAYGLAISVFIAASAVRNERRTRRILAVLSKAVERREYLAGLLCGTVVLSTTFFMATGIGAHWMATRLHLPAAASWSFIALLIVASVLLASCAIFFSTFLHPLLATFATALALSAQIALERTIAIASSPGAALAAGSESILPTYGLTRALTASPFQPGWSAPATAASLAIVEAILLWILASKVFERRDIALAIE
jgi:hypothetical protein